MYKTASDMYVFAALFAADLSRILGFSMLIDFVSPSTSGQSDISVCTLLLSCRRNYIFVFSSQAMTFRITSG